MRCQIGVVTSSKVAVVRRHNGVLFAFLHISTIPLTNTRAISICQNDAIDVAEEFLKLSHSMVTRICSEPGVMVNWVFL
jgi:hypothetical protein